MNKTHKVLARLPLIIIAIWTGVDGLLSLLSVLTIICTGHFDSFMAFNQQRNPLLQSSAVLYCLCCFSHLLISPALAIWEISCSIIILKSLKALQTRLFTIMGVGLISLNAFENLLASICSKQLVIIDGYPLMLAGLILILYKKLLHFGNSNLPISNSSKGIQ